MATNSHLCVFQTLAFSRIVAGFKSDRFFSFALASIWHEQSSKTGTRTTKRVVIRGGDTPGKTQPKTATAHQARLRVNFLPVRIKATGGNTYSIEFP